VRVFYQIRKVGKMKHLIIFIALKLLIVNCLFAQLRVEYESVRFIDNQHIQVFAKIQNLGGTTSAFIPYGNAWRYTFDWNNKQDYGRIDALLEYRLAGRNDTSYDLPTSITIKTWFGTSIAAEVIGNIQSTGASNFYRWELIFQVPTNALDISVDLFSYKRQIPNRSEVIEREKFASKEAILLSEKADSLFEAQNYSEAYKNYSKAYLIDNSILPKIRDNYLNASLYLGDDALEKNDIESSFIYYRQANRLSSTANLSVSKLNQRLINLYQIKADSEFEQSNYGNAYFFYNEIILLDPNHKFSKNQIVRIESRKRNPTTATMLSIMPGLGQFYNKENLEGVLFFAIGGLFLTSAIINLSNDDEGTYCGESIAKEEAKVSLYYYGALAVWSMYRARSQSNKYNESLITPNEEIKRFKIAFVQTHESIKLALRINF